MQRLELSACRTLITVLYSAFATLTSDRRCCIVRSRLNPRAICQHVQIHQQKVDVHNDRPTNPLQCCAHFRMQLRELIKFRQIPE